MFWINSSKIELVIKNICTFVGLIDMKRIRKNIIIQSWELFVTAAATWDNIASEKVSKNELRKYYVFPWITVCVLVVFILESVYATEKGLEKGLLNAIITAVSFLGSYFLSNKVCFWYLRKQHLKQFTEIECEKIVSYSFTTIFALKVFTTALPSLFFLQILSVYTAFLVWEGCRAVLKLTEEERGNIVLVFTVLIILLPVLINKIIHLMLPNA